MSQEGGQWNGAASPHSTHVGGVRLLRFGVCARFCRHLVLLCYCTESRIATILFHGTINCVIDNGANMFKGRRETASPMREAEMGDVTSPQVVDYASTLPDLDQYSVRNIALRSSPRLWLTIQE